MKKIKNKKERKEKRILFIFYIALIFLVYAFSSRAEALSSSGFHSIDSAFNHYLSYYYLEPYLDDDFDWNTMQDRGTDGIVRSFDEWYNIGIESMQYAKVYSLLAGLIMGNLVALGAIFIFNFKEN